MSRPNTDFQGRIGTTVADSEPWWPDNDASGNRRPNVVTVVLDDTGWSDFGCYGSEIATPTIDRLAADGLRYTNFHVTPLCSPTRASLLTGRNHHRVGMRFLADTDTGFPNARGRIDADVPTLPRLLREQGYGTYLAGKWHLAPLHEITPAGPFHNWPLGKGFDRFYGFLGGCTDQYAPELFQDNAPIEPPPDEGYHLSADLVNQAIRFVTDHVAFRTEQPFYLQLAFGATHAPFQAPREYVDKYVETFAKGWDQTRADRFDRQVELGLVPPGSELSERAPGVPAWNELDDDRRELFTHLQAAFAGFLEHTDAQLGLFVAALERLGLLDDTVIVVCADNGASREGGAQGAVNVAAAYNGVTRTVATELSELDRLAGPDGPSFYPEGWANAGNTPFQLYKQYVDLGGVRSGLVVHWPRGVTGRGEVRRQFVHVVDLAPTLLELAGTAADLEFDGASIVGTFDDVGAGRDTQYWEMLGHRAIWHRGWKAVTCHEPGAPFGSDKWRLYDTTSDFSECRDLAAREPGVLADLQELWWREAKANDVLPLDDRRLKDLLKFRPPLGIAARRSLRLHAGQSHLPTTSTLCGLDRSMRVRARLTRAADGVVLASGGSYGGYVLYVQDGVLSFEYHFLDWRGRATSAPLPPGEIEVGFDLDRRDDRSARLHLTVAGDPVDVAELPMATTLLSFWGLDVGRDPVSQVSRAYTGPFPMPADVLAEVAIDFLEEHSAGAVADAIQATE
ncbi:arylsulfatase [Kribbella aluminosa]|uniref:Arylsulfatase n=1 Tax=Kribbella aluminosa TaxID=416017 RepID=A0ABS4UIV6_9ACTN|nr:arylsulfatase [Kribbella aluminosa]MBP2351590.1 arylsulfatase [Kribbella aluminosa]